MLRFHYTEFRIQSNVLLRDIFTHKEKIQSVTIIIDIALRDRGGS